jgi:type III secretion protein J
MGPLLRWATPRRCRAGLLLVALVCLAGCRVDLHTKTTEADANEMLGTLLAAGVDARKLSPDSGKTWSITVDEAQTQQAIQVLRDNALPRERRPSLGDLFKKEGLISSPTEERVRFLFGVEQALSETLSRIDGVVVARVHIVLPNNDPLATSVKPSSAAVFIKHRRSVEIQTLVPAIKNLVVHAVEGLEYNQVTVTPVAADVRAAEAPLAHAGPAAAPGGVSSMLAWSAALLLALGGAAAAVAKRKGWRFARLRPASPPAVTASTGADLLPSHDARA